MPAVTVTYPTIDGRPGDIPQHLCASVDTREIIHKLIKPEILKRRQTLIAGVHNAAKRIKYCRLKGSHTPNALMSSVPVLLPLAREESPAQPHHCWTAVNLSFHSDLPPSFKPRRPCESGLFRPPVPPRKPPLE